MLVLIPMAPAPSPRADCPHCGFRNGAACSRCISCDRRLWPAANAWPPHPSGVNELGLRVGAAIMNDRLRWSDVALSLRLDMTAMTDIFQGRAPEDPESRLILETVLNDCGG